MTKVDLSVVLNCFKKEKYLKEAIDSVFQNTWQPKEIILVHDGCKDAMSYRDCTTIILDKNIGVARARDIGIHNTTGHFVLFLDGDDKIAPDYIEKAVKTDTDIAYSDIMTWYNHEEIDKPNKLYSIPKRLTLDQMWGYCRIVVSSVITRKVYDEIGGFRKFDMFEDWDFWLRCMTKGYRFKKFESLFYYRQTNGTRNQNTKEVRKKYFDRIKAGFIYKKGDRKIKSTIKELRLNDTFKK